MPLKRPTVSTTKNTVKPSVYTKKPTKPKATSTASKPKTSTWNSKKTSTTTSPKVAEKPNGNKGASSGTTTAPNTKVTEKPASNASTLADLDALFNEVNPKNFQITSATSFSGTHPFVGNAIPSQLNHFLEGDVKSSNRYHATHKFAVGNNYTAYVVRDDEDNEIELNCIHLYVLDKRTKEITGKYALSCISTSGMLYQNSQSWFTYINNDDLPDLVKQSVVTHYQGLTQNDVIGKVWQNNGYSHYPLSESSKKSFRHMFDME